MLPARCLFALAAPLALAAAPVHFEPNLGQAPAAARYVAAGARNVTLFTADGPVFASRSARIGMLLDGSRRGSLEAQEPAAGCSNYFFGPGLGSSRTGVPHFARLRYAAVYRGIDLVFHGSQGAMEYDFTVAPGADPATIRMRFQGASKVTLDGGSLVVSSGGMELRHRIPVAYQEIAGQRRTVDVRYRVSAGVAGFALGPYDRTRPLVIDPVLVYATYLGGSGYDSGAAVALGSAGDMLVAGSSTVVAPASANGPGGQPVLAGFLARLDPTGATVTDTYIVGSDDTAVYGMALDSSGNIVLAGQTASYGAITASQGAYQTNLAVGFVVKFASAASKPLFTSAFAASPTAVAVDSSGNIYVTGAALFDYPTTTGSLQTLNAGGADVFLLELTADGSKAVFATYLGGSSDDVGRAVRVDNTGIYVAGDTASANFPLAQPAQSKFGGRIAAIGSPNFGDAFVAKLDPTGSRLIYSTFLGGSAPDIAFGLVIDAGGNAYVTGATSSADFPTTQGAYQTQYAGPAADPLEPFAEGDAFVAKYSPQGLLRWSTLLGGSGLDSAAAIALDAAGNVYIAGSQGGASFPLTPNYIPNCRGTSGPFVAELDPAGGKLLHSTGLSGMGFDLANAIALDSAGLVYLAGDTSSQVFFVTASAAQKAYGGGDSDAFLARIDLNAQPGIFVACVLNAASLQPGNQSFFPLGTVAPGEIVSLFGLGLGPNPPVQYPTVAAGAVASTLGGTQVFFDNIPAPLLYAGPNQVNAIVPYGVNPAGSNPAITKMTVVRGGATYGPVIMPLAPAVPAIFSLDGSGIGEALVINQDGTINSASNPASRGSYVTFYAEGAGLMTPAMADGAVAALSLPLPAPALPISVTVRGQPATVLYAGAAPGFVSGLLQINVIVPTTINFGSDVPLFLAAGTTQSQLQLSMAVK